MIEMRQFLFLTVFLLFSSIPNLQAKVSSEDIENWFDDNYWVKRFEIFDDALCDIMSSKKDTKIDSCEKDKELSQIKYDADFLRKYEYIYT